MLSIPSLGQDLFAMNVKLKPWSDIHVRRAVAYAIDRSALITAFGGPHSAVPLHTIIPPPELRTLGSPSQVDALLDSLPRYPYDVAKAKQELRESVYPTGFTASIDTTNCCGFPDVLQVLAAELQKIGIKLNITSVTCGKFVTALYGPRRTGRRSVTFMRPSLTRASSRGTCSVARTQSRAGSTGRTTPPASIDELLARGLAKSKPAIRLAIYGQILRMVATDVPYVPLFNFDSYIAVSNKVTTRPFAALSYQIPWALLVKPTT